MVEHELAAVLRSGPFERALRVAIRSRGLSLDRVHARLRERGIRVSLSSLSYWQRGRSRPERASSLAAVRELEVILALPDYSLIGLLGPPRPRGRGAGETLAVLSDHEQVIVGADRKPLRAHARIVVRAKAEGVDRYVVTHPVGTQLVRAEYCRLGRTRIDEAAARTLTELVFDHPLSPGETRVVEFATAFAGAALRMDRHVRHLPGPVGQHLVQVRFRGSRPPVRCYHVWSPDAWSSPRDVGELRVDSFGTVHLLVTDARPGVRGVRWEWD